MVRMICELSVRFTADLPLDVLVDLFLRDRRGHHDHHGGECQDEKRLLHGAYFIPGEVRCPGKNPSTPASVCAPARYNQ